MENIVNSTIALYKAYRKTRCGKRDNPTAMRRRLCCLLCRDQRRAALG